MKKKKLSILFIGAVVLLISVSSCYAKGPWRGKVIDVETKQPIEGAAVVARWDYETTGPAGGATNFLDAQEAVTNKDGEFEISPKSFLSIPLFRRVRGPWFTIFKPGYGSFPRYQVSPTHTPEALFEGTGAVVELPMLKSREERIKKRPLISDPFLDHDEKKKYFIKLLRQESLEIGLEPEGGQNESR